LNSVFPEGKGAHVYVSPKGADDADGSKEKPIKTIAKALTKCVPGVTVHFAPGYYYLVKNVDTQITGSAEAPLRLIGEPGAIFTNANPDLSGVGKLTWEKFKQDPAGRWIYKTAATGVTRVMVRKTTDDPSTGYFLWGFRKDSRGPHCGQSVQDMIEDQTSLNEFGVFFQDADALYLTLPKGVEDPAKADFQICQGNADIWFRGNNIIVEGLTIELCAGFKVREPGHHITWRRLKSFGMCVYGLGTGPNALVEDCLFKLNSHWDWITSPPGKNGKGAWHKVKNGYNDEIAISTSSGSTIRYNTFEGRSNALPSVGASGGGTQLYANVDIHNNHFNHIGDDCIEPDTIVSNLRVYDNKLENFFNGFSAGPIDVGPAFIVRNVFCKFQQAAIKMRNGPTGAAFYYHNSCYPGEDFHAFSDQESDQPSFGPDADLAMNIKTRNNIWVGRWRAYYLSQKFPKNYLDTFDFDYNGLFGLIGKPLRSVGESHSVNAQPAFADLAKNDLRLANAEQPFIDAGEPIKGINDEVPEPFQYKGKAPDIGAYEWQVPLPHYGVREKAAK
jgi:hypothetical protein